MPWVRVRQVVGVPARGGIVRLHVVYGSPPGIGRSTVTRFLLTRPIPLARYEQLVDALRREVATDYPDLPVGGVVTARELVRQPTVVEG